MSKITPFLWFDNNAEEAVEFYVGTFPGSRIDQVTRYPEGMPMPAGTVLTISFSLRGEPFLALNGGPQFQFNEAISLLVSCRDQEEIDRYWDALVDGGEAMACGWLKDRFGLSWQIVPEPFFRWIDPSDPERAARVMASMQTMVKFDLAALEAAARGD